MFCEKQFHGSRWKEEEWEKCQFFMQNRAKPVQCYDGPMLRNLHVLRPFLKPYQAIEIVMYGFSILNKSILNKGFKFALQFGVGLKSLYV